MNFRERLDSVRASIDAAAQKTGRSWKDISVVAVAKGVSSEKIVEAKGAGLVIFGENKVQEAEPKVLSTQGAGLEWHMIGHLQTNKIKTALGLFQMIQSVDSARLAKEISQEAVIKSQVTPVLLEVNISGQPQRFGFWPEQIYGALDEIVKFPGIAVKGLMGIAPYPVSPDKVRESFGRLRKVFSVCKTFKAENLEMKYLSMGMSDDFETAIEEGSNMIRLGRALFGER